MAPPDDVARSLPSRPSLRHLKLEAKRRLAAGEFAALYEAQLAIAREHGQPSWAALKRLACPPAQQSHVLARLRWVARRFLDAGAPGWAAPDTSELRRHFDDEFLSRISPQKLIATITDMVPDLREGYEIIVATPRFAQVQIAGQQVVAAVADRPPHRLTRIRRLPLGSRIADSRVAATPLADHPVPRRSSRDRSHSRAPGPAAAIAAEAVAELGLPGLVLAGGGPDTPEWAVARGWADLDHTEILDTRHRFPAYAITRLITATAVLRLVADGMIGLDDPANDQLRTLRLADGSVTVRELLTHTGGVASLADPAFADEVPELTTLTGPVLSRGGPRGVFRVSDGGYAALGQIVADVTRSPYAEAAELLVLRPLGMRDSSFPRRWPSTDPHAVTGHRVSRDMRFVPAPAKVSAVPAAGGMWTTAADLVRFGATWPSLLPEALAREAVRPHAVRADGHIGLGWPIGERGIIGLYGGGPGAFASLLVRRDVAYVALTNRRLPIQHINVRVLRACVKAGACQPR